VSSILETVTADIDATLSAVWSTRDGRVVPDNDDLTLKNDRVEVEAVVLYADLADSTEFAIRSQEIAAEFFKCYLSGVAKIIRLCDGEVRSFDGDRVMGVFLGDLKNTNAAQCGLHINYFFKEILVQKFRTFYSTLQNETFTQTVGIDRSNIHVVRAGVRNGNDLIWVGRAPNVAAKLSGIRDQRYATIITADVYNAMSDSSKISMSTGNPPNTNMWVAHTWDAGGKYGVPTVYGSVWWRR
jgi:class 3 adenylate cyclase